MPDIRHKLQKMDGIADKSIQELLAVAQGVYNNRETPEDKWMGVIAKANAKKTQNLARIFLVATSGDPDEKKCQLKLPTRGQGKDPHARERPRLQKDQCAHRKEMGHWAKNCPQKSKHKHHDLGRNSCHVLVAESGNHSD